MRLPDAASFVVVIGAFACSVSLEDKSVGDAGANQPDGKSGSGPLGGSWSGGTGGGASVGGSIGSSGSSGSSGAGGSVISCAAGQKACGADCVSKTDWQFGCAAAECTACALTHAEVNGCDTDGACTVMKCDPGYGDCDGDPSNGCETNTSSDPWNCGACASACNSVNGTPSCVGSACKITCAAGFADCDGNVDNGCEVYLKIDVNHCGSCGHSCGDHGCKDGSCCTLVTQDCSNMGCCNSGKCDNLSFGGLSGKYCTG